MNILGINGGVRLGYQDVSAALIVDGKVVAAIEEERLNRVKLSPGRISEKSIDKVLEIGGLTIKDIDVVASHGETWGEEYQNKLENYFKGVFGYSPLIKRYHHHDAHAASTFFASGYEKALVITIDNSGDGVSTQISIGEGKELKTIKRFTRPNSLGIFYSMITQYCGFTRDSDEYKLMGLASYGAPKYDLSDIISSQLNGNYTVNEKYLKEIKTGESQPTRQEIMFSDELISLLGPNRKKREPINQHYKDVAASAQKAFEDVFINLIEHFVKETGISKICLAGGVALNCVMNQKIMNLDIVEQLYIQPASGDAGISLGSAYLAAAENETKVLPMENVYLGSSFSDDEIEKMLNTCQIRFKKTVNKFEEAAKLIAEGKVIGWFQGRDEFGPRALGNRSILASPLIKGMNDIVNKKIKFRETFRPFCPSVLEEDSHLYFEGKQNIASNMTITYDVKQEIKEIIPAVTHIDGTARIQTVNKSQNLDYYNLLIKLKDFTGHGVVMNTSFNVKDEPIVHTPQDAIKTFYGSGIDALCMGNYLIEK